MKQKLFAIQMVEVEWERAQPQLGDCLIQGHSQTQSQDTQNLYAHVKHLILMFSLESYCWKIISYDSLVHLKRERETKQQLKELGHSQTPVLVFNIP